MEVAKRLRRLVPALLEPSMRTGLLEEELAGVSISTAALELDALAAAAEQADPASREVIAALLPLLYDPSRQTWVDALREAAKDDARLALARLLRRKQSHGSVERRASNERGVALEPGGRPLSLGERRALARKPSRVILDKLLADPHPLVIKNLLANPRLTEDDVVRIAAKRPALPEIVAEIARSSRWMCRSRVRMALVLNPGTPPELSVPVLSQLVRPELVEVAEATLVPKVLRSAALELLQRRPPSPDRSGGSPVQ
jgi:hypothetical protein